MLTDVAPGRVGDDLASSPTPGGRPVPWDGIAVAALLALIPIVHDLSTMLTAPYWLDEAWVALSVRFPLGDLPVTTSSTPIGWSLLLRLVPDEDYLRVVPLFFHALTVCAAYALGRLALPPGRRTGIVAGLVCGAGVLLLPAQQVRHDLKQYSADAFVAVGLLALTAWTERGWSRQRLGILAAAIGVGMFVSHVTAIIAPCVLGGLFLATSVRRQWARLVEVTVTGFSAALAAAAVYLTFSARARSSAMQEFWAAFFPRLGEVPGYLGQRGEALSRIFGAPVPLVLCLVVVGVVTFVRWDRPATAGAVLLLPLVVITLAVSKVYPLLDPRTSHFLFVTAAAVAGVGLSGLAHRAATIAQRVYRRPSTTIATATVCAVLVGAFAVHNSRWYRFDGDEPGLDRTPIAMTDVREQTRYVNAHRARNDVIVLSSTAAYGFAFYSTRDDVSLVAPYSNTVTWWIRMPVDSGVVVISGPDEKAIRGGLGRALTLAGERGGARVWLIRSFVVGEEVAAWQAVLADYRVEQMTKGVEPVAVISEH
ncbi:hypothetical protein [Micromonospora sp. NPDC048839]|uniref:hypothetical protein n=1 Tax=Micromonospora sp. NPDC048839 TaxID=3155641 RepID=UPI0033DED1C4